MHVPEMRPAPPAPPTPAPAEAPAAVQYDARSAKDEVLAAMEAALAEARIESQARLDEARRAGEYGRHDPDHCSSWVVERAFQDPDS